MVYLVEDHEGARRGGEFAMQARPHGDLGVGHDDAVELPRLAAVPVAEARVEADAGSVRGIGPLHLEVLRRGDDRDAIDDAALEELGCQPQREGRLAGAGRRRDEEVAPTRLARGRVEVGGERLLLPRAQLACGAPGGAFREARREVVGGSRRAEDPLTRCLVHLTQG
ncbi:hypothetical protein GCM10025869_31910 [Homoserinibacter gongjuensis]|uniref:Uncharacterized protein n=1 Tax=Homoserinibacter gongjuensis TaxID=1162968 RepID=A0ABQ6JYC1_9MICO|nr:hypothetical protein GCM10025869_31910 [Homoserinibacter gongjuensis]